jgi:DNA processing protein
MDLLRNIKAWYRLLNTKTIGYAIAHKLIDKYGNPADYIGKKSPIWSEVNFINANVKESFQIDIDPPYWDKICDFIEFRNTKSNVKYHFISILDDNYPEQLKSIFQAPLYLNAFGNTDLLNSTQNIAIVGTRKPTNYGKFYTEKITESLVNNNFIITSGLALGIDAIAHKKAIELFGLTIAVLACGIDSIYPPQNKLLSKQIIENDGLIISENLPCTPFEKHHFPQRNRIISGLSKAVCIIEGKIQSGAMITAKLAIEQNRDVYALPGDINKPESEGPNSLIQNGSRIILNPKDITNDYCLSHIKEKSVIKTVNITEAEKNIINIIKLYPPEIHLDQIIYESKLDIGEISEILFMLEMKNVIKTCNNGKYTLNYEYIS